MELITDMDEELQQPHTVPLESDLFDGNQLSPEFVISLKDFLKKYGSNPKAASGVVLNVPGSSSHYAIAHGLGATPKLVSVSGYAIGSPSGFVIAKVNTSGSPAVADSTNIYIDITDNAACDVYWAAITF